MDDKAPTVGITLAGQQESRGQMSAPTTKHAYNSDRYRTPEMHRYDSHGMSLVGRMAEAYVERWGMVAAIPDGEDSGGRQKMRLPTTKELVDRAFDIAEAVFSTATERGNVFEAPDIQAIFDEAMKPKTARDSIAALEELADGLESKLEAK